MVQSGTVSVTVSGVASPLSARVTVNARTNFAFTAVSATKVANGSDPNLTVPNPPTPGERLGASQLDQYFTFFPETLQDNGPNQGFKHVTSVNNSGQESASTRYRWVIAQDLENVESDFFMNQCGNYNARTNPSGFISGSALKSNTIHHESANSNNRHYFQYVQIILERWPSPRWLDLLCQNLTS